MRITLIRHGETKGNREHRYVGKTDEELTQEGISFLKKKQYPAVQYVLVSPRLRCIQTMQNIYPNISYEILEELAECDFGAYEYKNFEELKKEPSYQAWIDSQGTMGFPDGETMEVFIKRTINGFWKGVKKAKEMGLNEIAFVAHGGTIMAILSELSVPHQPFYYWQVENGEGFQGNLCKEYMINLEKI